MYSSQKPYKKPKLALHGSPKVYERRTEEDTEMELPEEKVVPKVDLQTNDTKSHHISKERYRFTEEDLKRLFGKAS